MKSTLIRFGVLALMIAALAGCSDGTDGAAGAPGAPGVPGAALVNVTNLTAAEWTALTPTIDPASISVTIASPPVVKFRVTDANGNPLVGLGNKSGTNLANMWFTLAKLVPVTGGPSKWVTYLVTSASTSTTTGAVADANGAYWLGNFPQREREGTMLDKGDGTYEYTFFRDITKVQGIVTALPNDPAKFKYTADLNPTQLNFDPAATHRLGIVISGNQPGSSPAVAMATPTNVTKDFRPDGGTVTSTRTVVQRSSCDGCHSGKVIGHGDRRDPNLCVTCHTDQVKYTFDDKTTYTAYPDGDAPMLADGITFAVQTGTNAVVRPAQAILGGRAVGNFPNLVHKMHMSEELIKQGYIYNNDAAGLFNEKKFSQSPLNCTKCHDGIGSSTANVTKTIDGDNWKNVPSRLACGACHDGIDFATGLGITLADRDADIAAKVPVGTTQSGHNSGVGGGLTDDSTCASSNCHTATNIALVHESTVPTLNNPTVKTGVATITYNISSVTVDSVTFNPVIKFTIKNGTSAVMSFAVPTLVTNAQTGQQVIDPNYEPIPGFAGGPSFYVAYSVPQDGIATPADFNVYSNVALANLMVPVGTSPNQGTLTDDGNGNFTATLTGDLVGQVKPGGCVAPVAPAVATCVNTAVAIAPITVPAAAKMVTGAMIGTFTQKNVTGYPYIAADVSVNPTTRASGGVIIKSMLKKVPVLAADVRRTIVDASKCNSCHEQLGTSPEFHGGARNDPTACNFCHNGDRTSNGWSADASTFIHGIHGASKRTVGYTWAGVSATDNYSMIEYPGVLKNCNQCHLPDTVNFAATGGATVQPNLLWSTTAAGTISTTSNTFRNSPYVVAGTNYGTNFSYTVATGVTVQSASTTLVNSPIASACFACHDTDLAKLHMEGNGGAIYKTRLSQSDLTGKLINQEQCLVCHGKGRIADAAVVHK